MQPNSHEAPAIERFEAPIFFFSNDTNNQITFASDSVEDVLGYRANVLIGRNFMDFLVPDHLLNAAVVEKHRERFRTVACQNSVHAVRDYDGAERILAVQTYGDKNQDGRVVRSRGCAQDITEWHRQSEALFRHRTQLLERKSRLSQRDQTVLHMITNGYLNKQIGNHLDVSTRTIENVRSKMLDTLRVDHIAGAIAIESQLAMLESLGN